MEVKGKKVKLSIWVRIPAPLPHGHMADHVHDFYVFVGYRWPGTFSNHHLFLLPWSTGRHPGYVPLAQARMR